MSFEATSDPPQDVARLFSGGLKALTKGQKHFLPWVGAFALVLGGLQFVVSSGWWSDGGWAASLAMMFLYAEALDHWIKTALFPHSDERAPYAARRSPPPASGRFLLFCAAFIVLANMFAFALLLLAGVLPSDLLAKLVALVVMQASLIGVLATLFGGFLLYLPAQSAARPLTLGAAWDAAADARGRMIVFVLLCIFSGVVGYVGLLIVVDAMQWTKGLWPAVLTRAAFTLIDGVVLFVVAHGVATIYSHQTNWTPPPLETTAQ